MEICCGPLKFSSNFDSGNLGSAELVKCCEEGISGVSILYSNITHYEVNIRTKPDCAGTKYENGNRTWFYFCINGGQSNAVLKLNILNLNRQTKLYEQGMQPVACILPEKPKWSRIKDRVTILESKSGAKEQSSCGISFRVKLPADTKASTLFVAFSYPFSYSNLISWLREVESIYDPSPHSDRPVLATTDIYFKRETVCLSLEGRPMDLLTITDHHGMLTQCREPYLSNLFPYRDQGRCYKFLNKKFIHLNSRVHPGEVPAQFVMNGAIKFLLEEDDPRARLLRRLFVFKLIPMLNPDGVFRGHYRTDPRGVNLNRIYMQPSPTLHPTIYAARKLILYSHLGQDSQDDYEYEKEDDNPELTEEITNFSQNDLDPENNRLCAGCIESSENNELDHENVVLSQESQEELPPSSNVENVPVTSQNEPMSISHSRLETGFLDHTCTFESCDEDSDYQDLRRNSIAGHEFLSPQRLPSSSSSPPLILKVLSPSLHRSANFTSARALADPSPTTKDTIELSTKTTQPSPPSISVKSPEVESGLYAYIDLHGHATKRGIFMYGNHFNDIHSQTESLLVPRLFALNNQHFDYSSCVFTEKLMTMKDRRDGASREGSGRVAVLKLTGLIRSYTLECNYNTGRLVNHLITRAQSCGFVDPVPISVHPPKYTPEIFEDVGKNLLESVLDSTDLNPWSRLKYTEFRTLDGLRSFLRRRLEHSLEYQSSSHRSSSAAPGGSKSSVRQQSPRRKPFSNPPSSPSLKKRPGSSKILNDPSSPPSSSGPLIPKKDNQSVRPTATASTSLKSGTKLSKNVPQKPTSSTLTVSHAKTKLKSKMSKSTSLPTVTPMESGGSGLPSSSSSSDSRATATKLHKSSTSSITTAAKKKKKIIKRKTKKGTKTLQERPQSR